MPQNSTEIFKREDKFQKRSKKHMISLCSIHPMNAPCRDRMGDILICKLGEQAHVP